MHAAVDSEMAHKLSGWRMVLVPLLQTADDCGEIVGVQSRNAYSKLSVFRCSFGIRGSELGFDTHGFWLPLPSLAGIVA